VRIVHINNNIGIGGAQRVMVDLVNLQVGAGHEVTAVAAPLGQWWPEVAGRHIATNALLGDHGSSLRLLRATLAIRTVISDARPDVVHVHQRSLALATRVARLGRRTPVVVEHAHSLAAGRRSQSYRSDAIIAPGRAVAAHLIAHYPHCAPRIAVIPNSVADPGEPHPIATDGPLRLIAIGRLSAEKDPDWFVRFVVAVRDAGLPVQARWLGDGEARAHAQQLAQQLNAPVALPGSSRLAQLELVNADLLVVSSRSEGMPLAVLEAAAAGRATIARNVGAIAEVVAHGRTGLLVDPSLAPADAAAQLVDALGDAPRDVLQHWGTAARQHYLANHSPEQFARSVMQCYESNISSRRR